MNHHMQCLHPAAYIAQKFPTSQCQEQNTDMKNSAKSPILQAFS